MQRFFENLNAPEGARAYISVSIQFRPHGDRIFQNKKERNNERITIAGDALLRATKEIMIATIL